MWKPAGEIARQVVREIQAQTVEKPGGGGRMEVREVVTVQGVVLCQSDTGLALRFRSLAGVTVRLPCSLIGVVRERGEFDKITRPAWLAREKKLT